MQSITESKMGSPAPKPSVKRGYELFCLECGKTSPIMNTSCQCSLNKYAIHAVFRDPLYENDTLVVSEHPSYGELYWHFGHSGEYIQSMMPKNVFPIELNLISIKDDSIFIR